VYLKSYKNTLILESSRCVIVSSVPMLTSFPYSHLPKSERSTGQFLRCSLYIYVEVTLPNNLLSTARSLHIRNVVSQYDDLCHRQTLHLFTQSISTPLRYYLCYNPLLQLISFNKHSRGNL